MQLLLAELPKQIMLSFVAKTNLLFVSQPGIGKTETCHRAAMVIKKKLAGLDPNLDEFQYIEVDVPTMSPPDIGTYMPDRETRMLEFFANSTLPNAYRTPNAQGILHFGELLNIDTAVGKLLQKYINREDINGKLLLPKNFIVVADSNRITDKAGVQQQSRALLSRFEQIEVYTDAKSNIEFAERMDFHHSVQTFMKEWPDLIDNYVRVFTPPKNDSRKLDVIATEAEEGKRGIWACMRGWKRISDLEYAAETLQMELLPQRVIGNVGTAIGTQYMSHRAMIGKLASLDEIVRSPKTAKVPDQMDELYAQLVMLAMRVEQKHTKALDVYLSRVPKDLKAMVVSRLLARSRKNPATFNILNAPEYQVWMSDPEFSDLLMARN
jgi:hypothetical protein